MARAGSEDAWSAAGCRAESVGPAPAPTGHLVQSEALESPVQNVQPRGSGPGGLAGPRQGAGGRGRRSRARRPWRRRRKALGMGGRAFLQPAAPAGGLLPLQPRQGSEDLPSAHMHPSVVPKRRPRPPPGPDKDGSETVRGPLLGLILMLQTCSEAVSTDPCPPAGEPGPAHWLWTLLPLCQLGRFLVSIWDSVESLGHAHLSRPRIHEQAAPSKGTEAFPLLTNTPAPKGPGLERGVEKQK